MKDKAVVKKTVFLKSYGCQMNVRDSEVVAGLMKQAGYRLTDDEQEADIVIFNTCSVRQHAEDKVWSEIGRISKGSRGQRKSSKAKPTKRKLIGLIGCMAQNYKEKVFQRSPAVDFVVGPADIAKIPDIIASLIAAPGACASVSSLFERKIWETDGQIRPEQIYHTGYYREKSHAYVVISEGCSNFCSYCIVPYVRGPLRNRDCEDIIREIKDGVKKGITSFTLLGQNVNAYSSKGVSFIDLIKRVNSIEGVKEFGFITSHPRDTTVELFRAMASCEKLKKYLHLPVQSGSDRILEKMNRGYSRGSYLELCRMYRKIIPEGLLSTDIIVGFPGETQEDFQDTFDLVKAVGFDSAYIFKYSGRPHSQAFSWEDSVAQQEKQRRHALVLALQKDISRKKTAKR